MRLYWIWLSLIEGVQPQEKLRVLAHFSSPEDCYHARDYRAVEGLAKEAAEAFQNKDLSAAKNILKACARTNTQVLAYDEADYPGLLRSIARPPLVLYYRGILPKFNEEPMIGVVGTRKASLYGQRTAQRLGRDIAGHGGIVVSGMAEGIDGAVTRGALAAGKPVVGVLGCGPDVVYPGCNRELFQKMERSGCLISEYPPGTQPARRYFPQRNRIISGISCCVLVVEAPKKSGALITVAQALEQGRDVYAVPGNLDMVTCEGSNALLRDGAVAVTCAWDMLSEYEARYPGKLTEKIPEQPHPTDKKPIDNPAPTSYSDVDKNTAAPESPEERILAALEGRELHMDTLIAKTGMTSREVLAALTVMEVTGDVITRPGGWIGPGKFQ
jgi:DNA processing protein